MTTVLLVRHAEKGPQGQNDRRTPLSTPGAVRAATLAHVTENAGVTAIYTSEYSRTQQTVFPLAEWLQLDVDSEDDVGVLVNDMILGDHEGDAVLVASHSARFPGGSFSSVPAIIRELGGQNCQGFVGEYDNLYIVSVQAGRLHRANVVNLQYGNPDEPLTPDRVDCVNPMTTILLVRHIDTEVGESVAEILAHMTRKAGVTEIFDTSGTRQPAKSLADQLGLAITLYDPSGISDLVNEIRDYVGKSVIVAGERDTLATIIKTIGGSPYPGIPYVEYDDMYVMTVDESGQAKVVSLQFEAPDH
jgi:hypothetical protein